ncbi:hypothetical protein MMC21_003645 [Puttea exsequens]|nr:hypothetical protein [Puttea exsequens]
MAIWPFGRKNKKSSRSEEPDMAAAKTTTQMGRARTEPVREISDRSIPSPARSPSRKDSQRRRRSSTGKLTKRQSAPRMSEKTDGVPAVPVIPQAHRPDELNEKNGTNRSNQQAINAPRDPSNIPSYYFQNPMSASSLQPEKFSVLRSQPTLQGKRGANDQGGMMRRKSSKRKAEDHAREKEIKAMSSPIPIPKRPSSHQPGIMARDSKKIAGGLNRNFDRPLSDVSLPMPESLHSTMSVSSEQHKFKVSAFDALAPRPTIRYSENPRSAASSFGGSRTSTRKDKQPIIPEEMDKMSRRRIDDLADDMDAGTIKELMERDQRRLEKKRRSEQERLQRRLQRKSEKQREKEARGNDAEPHDIHRTPKNDDDVGLGIEGTSAGAQPIDTLQEPSRTQAVKAPDSWLRDPSREHLPAQDPFQDPVIKTSTSHLEPASPPDDRDEPFLGTAKEIRMSQASMSPPTSPIRLEPEPSKLSHSFEPPGMLEIPELSDPDQRRDSDTSARFSANWKSIFRRSDTRAKRSSVDRGRVTPSEFSNTSRESIARQMEGRQMPPSAFTRIPRVRSGTPIRTQSRFKEDLPEFPTPPDSHMQSPEQIETSPLPGIPGSRGNDTANADPPLSDIHPAFREEVALSRNASVRAHSPEGPPTAVMSQSLASVDSEGSWLTGKPVKRSSLPQPRDSAGSLQHRLDELGQSEDEEEPPGTPEAEKYMGSITPAREQPPKIPERKRPYLGAATGIGGDSDDDSAFQSAPVTSTQEETTFHGAVGKHPTIVRQGPGPRVKSREGLLNDFRNEESTESSPSGDSPVSPENAQYPTIQRATSVDIGKGHARHISAGSARLLNLPPRSSVEMKRFSSGSGASGERSPLMPSPRLPETHDDDVD